MNNNAADNTIFTTEHFTPGSGYFIRHAASCWVHRNWWWLFALPIALAIGSAWLPVLIFVALMLVFLLYPGVTMIVWFHCMLSPFARAELYEQQVSLNKNGLSRHYFPDDKFSSVPDNEHYSIAEIAHIEFHSKHLMFILKGKSYGYLAVPLAAIPEEHRDNIADRMADCGIDFACY